MILYGRAISKDSNSLEASGDNLRVKTDESSIERNSGGLRVKAGGVTADMLAGSIPSSKLTDQAKIAFLDQAENILAVWNFGTYIPTVTADADSANELIRFAQFENALAGLDFQPDVLDIQVDTTLDPGASPTTGDRYILVDSGNLHANFGSITGVGDNDIVEYDGSDFVVAYDVSVEGEGALVWDRDSNTYQRFTTAWAEFGGLSGITAGSGLTKSANTLNVIGGDGIVANADEIEADVDGSTIELSASDGSGKIRVKDAGIGKAKLNSDVVGNGLTGAAGSSLSVDPDSETGGNTQPVSVNSNGVGLDISAIVGTGIEADGSANIRLAVQGNGISGGAGSTLSVKADVTTGGDTAPVAVAANGVGVDVTALDGDHLDVDFTPSNYTPDAAPAEAADADDLAAHLKGIDTALGTVTGETKKEEYHIVTAGEVIAGYFELAEDPATASAVALNLANGIKQANKQAVGATGLTPDFDVLSTKQIHINNDGAATGLSEFIIEGDVCIVSYTY